MFHPTIHNDRQETPTMEFPAVDNSARPLRGRGAQRPCDLCRARKARCLLNKFPPCERCFKAGRPCTFDQEPPPRRPRPEAVESRFAIDHPADSRISTQTFLPSPNLDLFNSLHNDGQLDNGSFTLSPFNWPLLSASPQNRIQTPAYQALDGPAMPQSSPPAVTGVQHSYLDRVEQSPRGTEDSPIGDVPLDPARRVPTESGLVAEGSALLLSPSSEIDPFLRSRYVFDEQDTFRSSLRSFRRFAIHDQDSMIFMTVPPYVTNNMANTLIPEPEEPLLSEMHPFKDKLLSLFDRFVYPSYMIPVRKTIEGDPASSAILAAVYALALPWRSHDPSLPWALFEKGMTRRSAPDANRLYRYIWQYVSRGMHAPSYSIIHACLLLVERRKDITFPTDSPFDSSLLSSLISIAYAIGLHRDPSPFINMNPDEKEHRERLWWLIYIQDRWLAAATGQPTMIKEEDFDVARPEALDDTMTNSGITFCAHAAKEETYFAHLFALTEILDDILKSFMTLQSANRLASDVHGTIDKAQALHERLEDWRSHLDLEDVSPTASDTQYSNYAALRVACIYCHVLIYRTILQVTQNHIEFTQHYHAAQEFLTAMSKEFQSITLIEFGLFWFSWSRVQFNTITDFFVLMIVLAPDEQLHSTAKSAAAQHRQWLWLHVQSFEVGRMSMVRLDTLLDAIEKGRLV